MQTILEAREPLLECFKIEGITNTKPSGEARAWSTHRAWRDWALSEDVRATRATFFRVNCFRERDSFGYHLDKKNVHSINITCNIVFT